tara:strand:+ start:361 stop:576 length:216 start_codon:yes stop_codon:yes gene_type:complete
MKSIEFTDEELNALLQLIDLAIKSQGLNVAQAGVILADKIRESASPDTEVESNPILAEVLPPSGEDGEDSA